MTLPELAIKRPVTTLMLIVSMIVLGTVALVKLPLAFLPDVIEPELFVQVPYEDASPEQVERMIARPLEEVLGSVKDLRHMWTRCDQSGMRMRLEFDWSSDMHLARVEVWERIDRVRGELPDDVGDISFAQLEHEREYFLGAHVSNFTKIDNVGRYVFAREQRGHLRRNREGVPRTSTPHGRSAKHENTRTIHFGGQYCPAKPILIDVDVAAVEWRHFPVCVGIPSGAEVRVLFEIADRPGSARVGVGVEPKIALSWVGIEKCEQAERDQFDRDDK